MGEPEPIETAPTDGTIVFGICMDAQSPRENPTWFKDGGWRFLPMPDKFIVPGARRWWPTHWRPLPEDVKP